MRIIFLDIDGVLNDLNFDSSNPGKFFRPEAVQTLADIVHQTDAKIVLSFTWKQIKNCSEKEYPDAYHQWQKLINTLADHDLEIFDTTPDINTNRPLEILEWLKSHENLNIDSWISIEDDFPPEYYAKYGIKDHLFQTYYFVPKNHTGGLKPTHIPAILQMFATQEREKAESKGTKEKKEKQEKLRNYKKKRKKGPVISMLDIENYRKKEEEYRKTSEVYKEELEKWRKRAREICQVYYELTGRSKVYNSNKVALYFAEETIQILADCYRDKNANYIVFIEDFVADDYAERLKAEYEKKKQQEEGKSQKDIEAAERAEWERLKAKYGE